MKEINNPTELTIYGNNELSRISCQILAQVIPQLESYTGKKIYTAEGKPAAKTPILIDQVAPIAYKAGKGETTAYISNGGQSLWLKIKICLHGGKYADSPREIGTNYTQYFERSYYIGEMQAQTLVKVETLEKIRQNYNFEILSRDEISEQVRAYNTALETAEKLRKLLPNFLNN